MIKGFRQIAFLTAISRVLGMVRDMSFAYFLGAGGLMDGFSIAFKVPNLARRLFGEGAASASLIPTYSEQLQKDPKEAMKLASTVVTVIVVVLSCIVLVGEAIIFCYWKFFCIYPSTQLKLQLAGIMLPYMILICTVAILAGILNAHQHFASPAAAPMVLNIFIIGSLFLSGWALKIPANVQVFVVAVAVILAGVVQILIQFPPMLKRGIRIRLAWDVKSEAFKKVIALSVPMIIGLTVTQINTLADDFVALWLSGSVEKGQLFRVLGFAIKYPLWEGAVSHLFYSQRLYQFPLGVLGISLAIAIFPILSLQAAKKDLQALCQTISQGLCCVVFIAAPATAGLLLVGKPLVSTLFERGQFGSKDAAITAGVLSFYALGLCGYFAQQVLIRAFYSLADSKTPTKSALLAVMTNIVLNLTLIWFMKTKGLAASTALCSYLQVTILGIALYHRLGPAILNDLVSTAIKSIIATLCMSFVVIGTLALLEDYSNIFKLLLIVPLAITVYILSAKLLGIKALSLLIKVKHEK